MRLPSWQSFREFRTKSDFDAFYDDIVEPTRRLEKIVAAQEAVEGWCDCCGAVVPLQVVSGAYFGEEPSLRAGMICPNGINARSRLILRALALLSSGTDDLALFEDHTPLLSAIERLFDFNISASEYLDGDIASGQIGYVRGNQTVHQDITESSYADDQFDLIVHNDVLEHVPNHKAAFDECLRILKPGGTVLFTVPFFVERDESLKLAELKDGTINQIVHPPEMHGDPNRGELLTFWHFGWDLLDVAQAAGFSSASVACLYDFDSGLMSDNHPVIRGGNNPPLVLLARKV